MPVIEEYTQCGKVCAAAPPLPCSFVCGLVAQRATCCFDEWASLIASWNSQQLSAQLFREHDETSILLLQIGQHAGTPCLHFTNTCAHIPTCVHSVTWHVQTKTCTPVKACAHCTQHMHAMDACAYQTTSSVDQAQVWWCCEQRLPGALQRVQWLRPTMSPHKHKPAYDEAPQAWAYLWQGHTSKGLFMTRPHKHRSTYDEAARAQAYNGGPVGCLHRPPGT